MSRVGSLALASACALLVPAAAAGQSLERMVASAPDGAVQFHFAARDGVCGNGRSYYRSSDVGYYGTYSNGMEGDESCARGPVRVVVVRSGHDVIRLETYAGPLQAIATDGKDLGVVSAADAVAYLLSVAATADGRPARDALQPAMLADSAVVTPQLNRLVRDATRSRDLRGAAISWLARRRSESGGVGSAAVQHTLDAIVRDQNESEPLRRSALSSLGSLDRGEGIPLLIAFASDADGWIVRQALSSLASSGDPRARQFVRTAVKRTDLVEESRATLIRGIGNEYALPADFTLLRDLYPTLNTDQERSALIGTLATAGGSDNINWLLALAKSPTETAGRRRQAVTALGRSDDARVREALKGLVDR